MAGFVHARGGGTSGRQSDEEDEDEKARREDDAKGEGSSLLPICCHPFGPADEEARQEDLGALTATAALACLILMKYFWAAAGGLAGL